MYSSNLVASCILFNVHDKLGGGFFLQDNFGQYWWAKAAPTHLNVNKLNVAGACTSTV